MSNQTRRDVCVFGLVVLIAVCVPMAAWLAGFTDSF